MLSSILIYSLFAIKIMNRHSIGYYCYYHSIVVILVAHIIYRQLLVSGKFVSITRSDPEYHNSPPIEKETGLPSNTTVSMAQAKFALKLFRTIERNYGNGDDSFVFSPMTISSTMAMVYAGANGRTKFQIANVVFSHMPDDRVLSSTTSIVNELRYHKKPPFYVHQNIYTKSDIKLTPIFTNRVDTRPRLELHDDQSLDLHAKLINQYVKQDTHGQIRNFITSGDEIENLRIMLASAIYFQCKFQHPFIDLFTKPQNFSYSDNQKHDVVNMMYTQMPVRYYDNDQLKIIGLKYDFEDDVVLYIILPQYRYGLRKLVASLNGDMLMKYIRSTKEQLVDIMIPIFEIDNQFNLMHALSTLGVVDLFDKKTANLSDMVESNTTDHISNDDYSNNKPIIVSHILHSATFAIDEKGSDATARIVADLPNNVNYSDGVEWPKPAEFSFIADHSFIFALVKSDEYLVLFGKYASNGLNKFG